MINDVFETGGAIPFTALTSSQRAKWSACAENALVANPYFEPECQIPAADYELDGDFRRHLVVGEQNGEFMSCLPVGLIRASLGPLHRRAANSRASWTCVGLGSPLLLAGNARQSADALAQSLRTWSKEGGPGLLLLDWLDVDVGGAGAELLAAFERLGVRFAVQRKWERPTVGRQDGVLSVAHYHVSEQKRHRKALERDLGGPMTVSDRAGDPAAIQEFLRLEASGWKGKDGGAFASRDSATRWFVDMCQGFALKGRLHMYALEAGGETLAMQCFLRRGDQAFFERIGHDERFNAYGPGVLLHVASVDLLSELGVNFVDSCSSPGNGPGTGLMRDLYPGRRTLATVIVAIGSLVDQTAVRLLASIHSKKSIGR